MSTCESWRPRRGHVRRRGRGSRGPGARVGACEGLDRVRCACAVLGDFHSGVRTEALDVPQAPSLLQSEKGGGLRASRSDARLLRGFRGAVDGRSLGDHGACFPTKDLEPSLNTD